MKPPLSKEVLFIYFSGQATVLQKQLIENGWRMIGRVETYFEWLQEWENSYPQFLPDVEHAFEKVQRILENKAVQPETDLHMAQETSQWADCGVG